MNAIIGLALLIGILYAIVAACGPIGVVLDVLLLWGVWRAGISADPTKPTKPTKLDIGIGALLALLLAYWLIYPPERIHRDGDKPDLQNFHDGN